MCMKNFTGNIIKSKTAKKSNKKPKVVGRFVVVSTDKLLSDRCKAYDYIF
jgi:hypothetical protein